MAQIDDSTGTPMPLKNGRFTPQERVFIEKMVATGDATYAAEKAGYGTPARRASQALQNPAITDEIRRQQRARIHSEVLPLAVDQHIKGLRDPKTPPGAKANLIGIAYKYGLAPDDDPDNSEPHTWDAARIRRNIERLEQLLQELSRPVLELEAQSGGIFE